MSLMKQQDSVRPGRMVSVSCMHCGSAITEFVPEGRNIVETCEACYEPLLAAFWAAMGVPRPETG